MGARTVVHTGRRNAADSSLAPRRSIVPFSPKFRQLLIRTPYRVLLTWLAITAGIVGGLGVVLDNLLPFMLIGAAVIAALAWLRGEALLDAWADTVEIGEGLNADLSKYRRALSNLAYRYRGITDFEETVVIRYWIGEHSDEDHAQCESVTQAANPTQSVLWRTVAFGTTGAGGQMYSFDGVGFQIEAEEETSIDFLPIREDTELRGIALFSPEIRAMSRKWHYSYQLKGCWDPLRNTLEDESIYQLEADGIKNVELRFVFPANRKGRFSNYPREGEVTQESDQGRFALCWRMENPRLTSYPFTLKMERPI